MRIEVDGKATVTVEDRNDQSETVRRLIEANDSFMGRHASLLRENSDLRDRLRVANPPDPPWVILVLICVLIAGYLLGWLLPPPSTQQFVDAQQRAAEGRGIAAYIERLYWKADKYRTERAENFNAWQHELSRSNSLEREKEELKNQLVDAQSREAAMQAVLNTHLLRLSQPLSGTFQIQVDIQTNTGRDKIVSSRWLGSFDQAAWSALGVEEVTVVRELSANGPGVFSFVTRSGEVQYVYWNSFSGVKSDQPLVVGALYRVKSGTYGENGYLESLWLYRLVP